MAFQILALSGGGYRGLFSAEILTRLEEQAGRPLGECFDLIAGTSIGGIIAIGLALGKPAATIRQVFVDKGDDIFTRGEAPANFVSKWWARGRGYRKPKYDGTELRKAIEAVVGVDALIGDAKTPLLVPAVNMTKGSVQMFKTAHSDRFAIDYKRSAVDVAMATSAAPFFFPMARIGDSYYVDGGIVANAPDMCAIHEATTVFGQKLEDIRVLSIGTITTGFSLPVSEGGNFGGKAWLKNSRLVSAVFSSQQQLVEYMVKQQLRERFVRMDTRAGPEQSSDLGLDLASADRRGTLLGMAEGVFQDHAGTPIVREMLAHLPARPKFFESGVAVA